MDTSNHSVEPTNLDQLQNTDIVELKKMDKKSPAICDESNSSDNTKTTENKIPKVDTIDETKIMSCDNMKIKEESEVEMALTKDDDQESKSNFNKSEETLKSEKSDVPSPCSDVSKNSNNEDVKESTTKGGSNVKRKRKSLITQGLTGNDSSSEENGTRGKRKKLRNTSDQFCWRCHKESVEAHCSACPRSWHRRCIGGVPPTSFQNWICGECATILRAENAETRSTAMADLSIDQLCMLLKHVVERMRDYPGSEPFWTPVEISEAPNYMDYVVKPMDLSLLESNVRAKLYGSTDAFMADAKWIQHNCIVFNTCGGVYADTSKLTNAAKQIIKVARQEVSEIEACPDCYAHGRNLPRPQPSWFIEPCRRPHTLVWAKLKGFPFWPAKAMPRVNSQGFVDVRFFGEHDRAWVSPRDLYLYSEDPPTPLPRKRKLDMDDCVREITRHCRKLELVFGQFKFAPPKVQYNPNDPLQIKLMLPNYDPLQPNNSVSTPFLTPKKKTFLRKRGSSIRNKSQNESTTSDTDSSNPTLSSNVDIHSNESNDESTIAKQQKLHKFEENEVSLNNLSPVTQQNEKTVQKETKISTTIQDKMTRSMDEEDTKKDDKARDDEDKTNDINHINVIEKELNDSVVTLGDNKDSQKETDNVKPFGNSINCKTLEAQESFETDKRVLSSKDNNDKEDVCQTLSNTLKPGYKSTKNTGKVYKPKTRMVDKVNAEKALKSVTANEQNEKLEPTLSNLDESLNKVSAHSEMADSINGLKISDINTAPPVSNSKSQTKTDNHNISSIASTFQSSTTNSETDQSVALFLLVNSGTNETAKQPTSLTDTQTNSNVLTTVIKQEPKDTLPPKKESKARKSFPNKPPNYPQILPHSLLNTSSNLMDTAVYIPNYQNENIPYQLLPPEAGPLSARLYHGAQELARKMAQLMEEAYKEAAQGNQNYEEDITDSHQATVHFLRLQIERMRWQHQQQLAELKHNTDRILREMRASLEAEKLRAIEKTRREAEEEKKRCIEETKRKQWCAMCGREALFYCCWNTAYCDYPCQQSHWLTHMRTCAQQPSLNSIVTSSAANSNQQQDANTKFCSPAGRVIALSHNKLSGISTSLYVSCSRDEGNQDSS